MDHIMSPFYMLDPSFHLQKMDPQIYKLLETSYEAWMDSGIDVRSLRDSNRVGVYTGICGSEVSRSRLTSTTVYQRALY